MVHLCLNVFFTLCCFTSVYADLLQGSGWSHLLRLNLEERDSAISHGIVRPCEQEKQIYGNRCLFHDHELLALLE